MADSVDTAAPPGSVGSTEDFWASVVESPGIMFAPATSAQSVEVIPTIPVPPTNDDTVRNDPEHEKERIQTATAMILAMTTEITPDGLAKLVEDGSISANQATAVLIAAGEAVDVEGPEFRDKIETALTSTRKLELAASTALGSPDQVAASNALAALATSQSGIEIANAVNDLVAQAARGDSVPDQTTGTTSLGQNVLAEANPATSRGTVATGKSNKEQTAATPGQVPNDQGANEATAQASIHHNDNLGVARVRSNFQTAASNALATTNNGQQPPTTPTTPAVTATPDPGALAGILEENRKREEERERGDKSPAETAPVLQAVSQKLLDNLAAAYPGFATLMSKVGDMSGMKSLSTAVTDFGETGNALANKNAGGTAASTPVVASAAKSSDAATIG